MKQSANHQLKQVAKLNPKLQQAIRLLKLSSVELKQEIQQQLNSNPLLESVNDEHIGFDDLRDQQKHEETDHCEWSHLYHQTTENHASRDSDYSRDISHCTKLNLNDHLIWQLELSSLSDLECLIAHTIIENINNDGFLADNPESLYQGLFEKSDEINFDLFETVRHRIMRFDPVGCASCSLSESLLIQLEQWPKSTPHLALMKKIIHDNLDLLADRKYKTLCQLYHINEQKLSTVIQLIQKLSPRPGSNISQDVINYTIPDLAVKKVSGIWTVETNHSFIPQLSINRYYAELINDKTHSADSNYLKNQLKEARWFLNSIHSRELTLLKVARYLVQHQQDFLNFGENAIKPLSLSDVAKALEIHESTVSRAVTQKYIHTPRGLIELKYFFSNPAGKSNTKSNQSAKSIQALIKQIIDEEETRRPLGDHEISLRIKLSQGVSISRRTVSKYRKILGIPAANKRKSL